MITREEILNFGTKIASSLSSEAEAIEAMQNYIAYLETFAVLPKSLANELLDLAYKNGRPGVVLRATRKKARRTSCGESNYDTPACGPPMSHC